MMPLIVTEQAPVPPPAYHRAQARLGPGVCVGFLQAERKDGRIGAKEGQSKRLEGEKRMLAEFDRRWTQLAQEVLSGMRDWRVQHPTATLQEIEEELDKRMASMRAGLLQDLAMASTAADVAGTQAQERPRCPTCGGMLQERGKQVRKLVTYGEQSVRLERSYGYCPTCGVGFFPPG